MEFKKGAFYKLRNGLRAEIYIVAPDYVFGAIERDHGWNSVTWEPDGTKEFNSDLDIVDLWDMCPVIKSLLKCECGHEKAKMPGHSNYCPKYEKL